jgi:hypothetical protein
MKKKRGTLVYLLAGICLAYHLAEAMRRPNFFMRLGGLVRYLAHSTPPSVIFGVDHPNQWLFLRQELEFQCRRSPEYIELYYLRPLREFLSVLDRHGIEVVVVPIPTKLSIYRDNGPRVLPTENIFRTQPPCAEDPDANYQQIVNFDPRVVDVMAAYRSAKRLFPNTLLYWPTDSHWTSAGTIVAAGAVLQKLKSRGWPIAMPTPRYVGPRDLGSGADLIESFKLPKFFIAREPAFRFGDIVYAWQEPLPTTPREPPPGRLILAGTSYSERFQSWKFSFGKLIAEPLHRELIRPDGASGGRAITALQNLNQAGVQLRRGDILVIEFSVRQPWKPGEYLPVPKFFATN